ARGVVYNRGGTPTVEDDKMVAMGTSTGVFSRSVSGLVAGTTYHVRAYATNGRGTSYGEEKTFTTLPPPVSTPADSTYKIGDELHFTVGFFLPVDITGEPVLPLTIGLKTGAAVFTRLSEDKQQ